MNILALDTSSDACSVAVLTDSRCHSEFVVEPRAHTRLILPMIEQVLARAKLTLAEIDALAFGRGPGAFTGVRIATGIVQGLALAANKPVIPVSTLAAIAQQTYRQHNAERVLVAVDARMSEVYWGAFSLQHGIMQLDGEESVLAPSTVPLTASPERWAAAGNGWQVYEAGLKSRFQAVVNEYYTDISPAAEYIAYLAAVDWRRGKTVDAALATPVYLRNKVAKTTRERQAQ